MPYSRSSFERVGHQVGRLYLERGAEIDAELAERMPMLEGVKSVSVAIDRVAVPMEEIEIGSDNERDHPTRVWHMAHAAAFTLRDGRGRALHTVRYAGFSGRTRIAASPRHSRVPSRDCRMLHQRAARAQRSTTAVRR